MTIMDDETKNKVEEALKDMKDPVHLMMFRKEEGCPMCDDTLGIVEELSSMTDRITLEVVDLDQDPGKGGDHNVDKVPAITVNRGTPDDNKGTGIRFFGIPAGFEFTSLLDSIITVSLGKSAISEEGQKYLEKLEKDIHLQVFVTPTCPYCPRSVVLAHHMAMVSDRVTADMVEAQEFPDLSRKYKVMGVPRTVVNEDFHQEGAAPENMIIDLIRKAVS